MDDKGDGDGWEVQDDWAPIENLEQDSFGPSVTTVRSKDSVLKVNAWNNFFFNFETLKIL